MIVIHNLTGRQLKLDTGKLHAKGRIIYCAGRFSGDLKSLLLDPFGSMICFRD